MVNSAAISDYKLHKLEPTNSIRFFNSVSTDANNEVLRISKDGVWANPDIPADEAAQLVLKALDGYVKRMVGQAIEAEREACAKWYEDTGWLLDESDVADAIRARGNNT